jgi:glycosyltransferase involved in cell wall biosynthesis
MHQRSDNRAKPAAIAITADRQGRTKIKTLLLCFSHLRWDFVWQRPQHLLSRAARDFDVIVFEEPVFEADVAPRLDITSRPGGIRVAVPILPCGMSPLEQTMAQRQLVERLIAGEASVSRIFWYYTPMAMAFSGHIPADVTVYDNMDELSAFAGASPELLAHEGDLFARADLVFTGGMSLYEAKRGRHPNVHAFPSSIEHEHFAAARSWARPEPVDQAGIAHPRLGFFGVIDERMNIDLVGRIAELRPDWQFVMIGPDAKIDPATLPRRANIHWLGPKSYADLPHYLAGWDVGIMPFALNEATRFISPTKTPEFLAAGVPVVSTAIRDVVRPYGEKGLVEIAASAEEMVAKAEILMARPRGPWLARVDRHLAGGSWDRTWSAMQRLIADGLGEPLSSGRTGRNAAAGSTFVMESVE